MAMEKKDNWSNMLPFTVRKVAGTNSCKRIEEAEEKLASLEKELKQAQKDLFEYEKDVMIINISEVTGKELARLLGKLSREDLRIFLLEMRHYHTLREKYDILRDKCRLLKDEIIYWSDPKYLLVEAAYEERIEKKHNFSFDDLIELMTSEDELTEFQRDWYDVYRKKNTTC